MDEVRAFVQGPARAWGEQIETTGRLPDGVWEELRDRGYLRLAAPTAYGGRGLPFTAYLALLEQFAQMHGSLRVIVHVCNGLWRSLDYAATEAQRERIVKPFVAGRRRVTFTLTEPDSGSGTDIRTTARREGDEYVLNGQKWMIIFSDVADDFLVFCRLEGTRGAEGTLALLVPRDAPGLEIRPMAPAMGVSGTQHGHLVFTDCRVPVSNRLGAEGQGLEIAFAGFLDPSRIGVAATCVGLASRALDLAVDHARRRITFGKPLAKRQTIQMWVGEMATDIEAGRQLYLHAARAFEEGRPATVPAAMAKLFCTDMLQRVTDKALQIHGGIGYFRSSEIERIYRDARMQRFEEGTAEIQKMVIARERLRKT
ncbi:MAG: acyl-CoA dehydrogenase family protein [Alicyclobacillaceae bacterium]|nr:acyl-CoA dehydrogenase family protein [Alicyclobacillaceae bacterium]